MRQIVQPLMAGIAVCALMAGTLLGAPEKKVAEKKLAEKKDAESKDREIALDKVPRPVLAAVKKKFPDAKLDSAAKETEEDEVLYEIFLKHKGHAIYAVCQADGKIIETAREISFKELPKPVVETLKKKYAKAPVYSIEEITEDDAISYDVLIKHAKKHLHVMLDPKGKLLDEQSGDEKE